MKEEIKEYIELVIFLRSPEGVNAEEKILESVLDKMDELWYDFDKSDYKEIDKLIKELKSNDSEKSI